MRWRLEALYPGIFHLRFNNAYDAAMHFVRYQENYESPVWRDKVFTLLEYMEWYAKDQSQGWTNDSVEPRDKFEMFSYPSDWGGFNVPSYVFDRLPLGVIPDVNPYDRFMDSVITHIKSTGYEKFYLIGTTEGPDVDDYLDHEVSHGLFYTNPTYRDSASELYNDIYDSYTTTTLRDWLILNGYCEEVIVDETAAYLATGLPTSLEKDKELKKAQRPFKKLFKSTIEALG